MTARLDAFLASMGSRDYQWVDDFDLESLAALAGAERGTAVTALVQAVQKNDPRAPRALAAIGAREAAPNLHDALANATGACRVTLALALEELDGYAEATARIIEALEDATESGRLLAAHMLRTRPGAAAGGQAVPPAPGMAQIGGAAAGGQAVPPAPGMAQIGGAGTMTALGEVAAGDSNAYVRAAAAESLMLLAGVRTSPYDIRHQDLLDAIGGTDRTARAKALERLAELTGHANSSAGARQQAARLPPPKAESEPRRADRPEEAPKAASRPAAPARRGAVPPPTPAPKAAPIIEERRFCRQCGGEFHGDDRFCSRCGAAAAAVAPLTCGACGRPLKTGTKYCGGCGSPAPRPADQGKGDR